MQVQIACHCTWKPLVRLWNRLRGVWNFFGSVENAEIEESCESIPTLIPQTGRHWFDTSRVLKLSVALQPFCVALRLSQSAHWHACFYIAALYFFFLHRVGFRQWRSHAHRVDMNCQWLPLFLSALPSAHCPQGSALSHCAQPSGQCALVPWFKLARSSSPVAWVSAGPLVQTDLPGRLLWPAQQPPCPAANETFVSH